MVEVEHHEQSNTVFFGRGSLHRFFIFLGKQLRSVGFEIWSFCCSFIWDKTFEGASGTCITNRREFRCLGNRIGYV